jgi:hypothetical protein
MYLPQQSEKAGSAPLRRMALGAPPQGHSLGNAACKAEAEVMGKGKFKPRPFE